MRSGCLATVALCALLIGGDQATLMKKFTPQADEAIAKGYAELLRQGKFDRIRHDLDPSLEVTPSTVTKSLGTLSAL